MSQIKIEENAFEALQLGSEGAMVHVVQKSLIHLEYNISENSIFDEEMNTIVKEFQEKRGIVIDGIISIETMQELDKAYLEQQKKKKRKTKK